MSKRAIITGAEGFVGKHLAGHLKDRGIEAFGFDRSTGGDILDVYKVETMIDAVKPDYIFHLAAAAFVPTSFADPVKVMNINLNGSHTILEAVRKYSPSTKVHLAGSSEVYGKVSPEECPIKETNPIRPQSTYAVAKYAMEKLAIQYHDTWGLHTVVTRAFNHSGPGRGVEYAESNFAKQVVAIERGEAKELVHGNLDAKRDYTDVRDMVKAYLLAIELPSDVYNVSSGETVSMKEVIDILAGLSKRELTLVQDASRMRPSDVPLLLGDSTKFRKLTGWKPTINVEKMLNDLLAYWRKV